MQDMVSGQPHVVGARAHLSPALGGDQDLMAGAGHGPEGLPDQPFGFALGINVGGVNQVDPGVKGGSDQSLGLGGAQLPDGRPEPSSPESHGSEAKLGDE